MKTCTSTISAGNKWSNDYIENELMEFVRHATSDKDALCNIKLILKQYKKRIKFFELVSLIFKK